MILANVFYLLFAFRSTYFKFFFRSIRTIMSWFQKKISLKPRSRGAYLITEEIIGALPELKEYDVGVLHLFLQHTSAGISLNENWDSDVRQDLTKALNELLPDDVDGTHYAHSSAGEGPDDMVGHIKSTRKYFQSALFSITFILTSLL